MRSSLEMVFEQVGSFTMFWYARYLEATTMYKIESIKPLYVAQRCAHIQLLKAEQNLKENLRCVAD